MNKDDKAEILAGFNEDICKAMLLFCKTQTGRLSVNRKTEFQDFVSEEVIKGAWFWLAVELKLTNKTDVLRYARGRSGEFYVTCYKEGKEKLAKVLRDHLKEQ